MMIKIDKGIPIPQRTKYPWREMAVGDSFFVAGKKSGDVGGSAAHGAKISGSKFAVRNVDGGVRVWRIK